jgi:hypothetical protein
MMVGILIASKEKNPNEPVQIYQYKEINTR